MSWITGRSLVTRVTEVAKSGDPDSEAAKKLLQNGLEHAQNTGDAEAVQKYRSALEQAGESS